VSVDSIIEGVIARESAQYTNDPNVYRWLRRGRDGVTALIEALQALQGTFLLELAERRPKDEEFAFGWFLNRVAFNPGANT
jgi:hypothetical protein